MKVFFSYSEPFVSPLFPEKGGNVTISCAFSHVPDTVLLRTDDDNGLLSSYEMKRVGSFNGAELVSATAPVTISDEIFHFFFVFIDAPVGRIDVRSRFGIGIAVIVQIGRNLLAASCQGVKGALFIGYLF